MKAQNEDEDTGPQRPLVVRGGWLGEGDDPMSARDRVQHYADVLRRRLLARRQLTPRTEVRARSITKEGVSLDLHFSDLSPEQAAGIEQLAAMLPQLAQRAAEANFAQRAQALLAAVLPADPYSDAWLGWVAEDAAARQAFLQQVQVFDSKQVADNAGHVSSNPSQTAYRWRNAGRIFSVNHGGVEFYPAFQFQDDGQPKPEIATLLKILASDATRTAWQNAFWFAGANGWLGGAAPIEKLDSEPQKVLQAAQYAVASREY